MPHIWLVAGLVAVAAAEPATRPALHLLRFRGGASSVAKKTPQAKTGKTWVTSSFTRDHCRFMVELPSYLGAYLNPYTALDAKTIESVMLTVNSINACPYCTGLHGELARMADADGGAKTAAVKFAVVFAEEGGRGERVVSAFGALVMSEGRGRAKNVRALCWALLWGKTTGNSINVVRGKLLRGRLWQLTPFDLLMFMYYGPLFLVIGVLNAMLKLMPRIPPFVSAAIGAVLWVPQALHILPAGLVCLALRVLAAPLGGLNL